MRGTSAKVLTPCPLPGSTPANAGSILLFCSKCQHLSTNSVGAPPHLRGKEVEHRAGVAVLRITPAHAGKRSLRTTRCGGGWDHPRACGEKSFWNRRVAVASGSSPHMRGKDVRQELQHSGRGITPAYAGKSGFVLGGIYP